MANEDVHLSSSVKCCRQGIESEYHRNVNGLLTRYYLSKGHRYYPRHFAINKPGCRFAVESARSAVNLVGNATALLCCKLAGLSLDIFQKPAQSF